MWSGCESDLPTFGTCYKNWWEDREMHTVTARLSVFESSHCSVVWGVRGCMWKIFFCIFFTLLFTVVWLASQLTPPKITPQKASASVDITSLLNVVRSAIHWTMHLNSTQQLLTRRLRFYRKNCAKPSQHFMQDEPASSWSKYSNMFQVIIILIFLHYQRDHWCKLGWSELFFLWSMVPNTIVKSVYKPCSELNHHLDQTSPLTQIIPVHAPDWGSSNGEKKQCVVYIFNVQISL